MCGNALGGPCFPFSIIYMRAHMREITAPARVCQSWLDCLSSKKPRLDSCMCEEAESPASLVCHHACTVDCHLSLNTSAADLLRQSEPRDGAFQVLQLRDSTSICKHPRARLQMTVCPGHSSHFVTVGGAHSLGESLVPLQD